MLTCSDCGLPYAEFGLDTVLPHDQWLKINLREGGVLCANCIVAKAVKRLPGATVARMVIEYSENAND